MPYWTGQVEDSARESLFLLLGLHADDLAGQSRIPCPPKREGLFHADPCCDGWRNHAVAIRLQLMLE